MLFSLRIGNLLVPNNNYCKFEDWLMPILDQMVTEQETEVSVAMVVWERGLMILTYLCLIQVPAEGLWESLAFISVFWNQEKWSIVKSGMNKVCR